MRAGMKDTRTRCDACGVELGDGPRALFRNPSLRGCCEECARLGDEGTLLCGGCARAVGYADLWAGVSGWPYDLTNEVGGACPVVHVRVSRLSYWLGRRCCWMYCLSVSKGAPPLLAA